MNVLLISTTVTETQRVLTLLAASIALVTMDLQEIVPTATVSGGSQSAQTMEI